MGLLWAGLANGAQVHPADENSDGALTIEEVTAYARAWAEGTQWPGGPSPVSEADVWRARFIWQNGERYGQVTGVAESASWVPAPLNGQAFVTVEDLEPEPLDNVELFGLPQGQQALILEYRVQGDSEFRYAPLIRIDEERWALKVPYLPQAPGGAAAMELWLLSADERFPVIPIRPRPLPASSGTAAAIADGLLQLSDRLASLFGSQLAQYHDAPPEAIPPELRPLVMIDRMLQDADNPNNLSRVLKGTAPLLQESGLEIAQLDAILGKLGLQEQLLTLQALLPDPAAPLDQLAVASALPMQTSSAFVTIQTLGQLSAAMTKQCVADRIADPGKEFSDIKDDINTATVAIGMTGPVGAAGVAAFSVTSWTIESIAGLIANQWPSEVDNVELEWSQTFSFEDDCTPARWSGSMSARSRDWSLDKVAVTGALNLLSLFKLRADLNAVPTPSGQLDRFGDALSEGEETAVGFITDISSQAMDRTFPKDSNLIPIPAAVWSGILITDDDFGLIDVDYEGDAVKRGDSPRFVVPNAVGRSTVRVRMLPGALSPCSGLEGTAHVYEVFENKVALTPTRADVSPDEEITFTATVTDALDLGLEFEASAGEFIQFNLNPVTGVHSGVWRAPPKELMPTGPITITARSTANTCVRETEVRQAEAILLGRIPQFALVPAIYCIEPGGLQQFEVVNLKLEPVPPVSWALIGDGSLEGDGAFATYTAAQEGSATVRATIAIADGEPVILDHSFAINCGMLATFYLASGDGPAFGQTVKAQTATFMLDEGIVDGDVFFDYSVIQPLAGADPFLVVKGEYQGTALFTPGDPNEAAALADTSEALRWYPLPTNPQGQYAVEAVMGLELISEDENIVLLPDGKLGDRMEIKLDAGASAAGGLVGENQFNEIVSYNWTFSDGTQLFGPTVTKNFSRSLDSLTCTLEVVDRIGNYARVSQTLVIVQVSGSFAFPFETGGALTASFLWDFPFDPPPPEPNEDGYTVFITDPLNSRMNLNVTGGRTTKASANTSAAGRIIEIDFDKYVISFLPFELSNEE